MKKFLFSGALFLYSILSAFAQFSGSGSGTENDPYLIFNVNQLRQVGNYCNKRDVYFKLMNDIDLKEWIAASNRSQGWKPIGGLNSFRGEYYYFYGILDGNGYTISGLKIMRDDTDNVGLFEELRYATIKNLTVKGDISGQNAVGGIAGKGYNITITNCRYEGKVNGKVNVGGIVGLMEDKSPLTDCSMQGEVKGTESVGGIVGGSSNLSGKFSNLKSNGTITATGNNCGGLFGLLNGNKANISGCAVENAIKGSNNIGGIVGSLRGNENQFWDCTAKVTIHGHDYVGGFIGHAENYPFYIMSRCNSVIDLTGNNCVGGILGGNTAKVTLKVVTGEDGKTIFKDHVSNTPYTDATIGNNLAVGKISCTGDSIGGISGKFDFNYATGSSYELEVRPGVTETFTNYYIGVLDIIDCAFSGEIKGMGCVGGIAGYHHGGTIKSCYSNAMVTGTKGDIGGVVGKLEGYVDDNKSIYWATIKSCVTTNPIVCTTSNQYQSVARILGAGNGIYSYGKVGTPGTAEENAAIASTRILIDNKTQFIKDGEWNGTSVRQEDLKKIEFYKNKGWNFQLGTFWVTLIPQHKFS